MTTRVLIVDDDPRLREMIRTLLEDEAYDIAEAEDGATALAMVRAARDPMVVLLDYLMPGVNGEEVLCAVAEDPELAARHAFVLVTAQHNNLPASLTDLLARMAIPVIGKPFEIDHFLDVVAGAAMLLDAAHTGADRLGAGHAGL